MALISKLEAIGNAIREKTGKSDLLSLDDMATEITNLSTGGGDLPEEAYTITGECSYRFNNGAWDWFIRDYGNKITTVDMINPSYMFQSTDVEKIPFSLNFDKSFDINLSYTFKGANNLTEIPEMNTNGARLNNTDNTFFGCNNLRYLPEDIEDWFDWSYMDSLTNAYGGGQRHNMFQHCYSLRSIPMGFLAHANPVANQSYAIYSFGFNNCYALDEIVGLPIPYANASWTSNAFNTSFSSCSRLKEITFALQEDGTPYVCSGWKKQTIDLTKYTGYTEYAKHITDYNSGITADKRVYDADSYAALKDDPDWFTWDIAYSRYNHDSAVNTINSLPDCSALGENTIKFKGASGALTDGGAINTLTEEEIAVAAAKGWTVSLA